MPRHSGSRVSDGIHAQTTRQKGRRNHYRRGRGLSTYCRMEKGRKAERYDRPYLDGRYDRDLLARPVPEKKSTAKGHRFERRAEQRRITR